MAPAGSSPAAAGEAPSRPRRTFRRLSQAPYRLAEGLGWEPSRKPQAGKKAAKKAPRKAAKKAAKKPSAKRAAQAKALVAKRAATARRAARQAAGAQKLTITLWADSASETPAAAPPRRKKPAKPRKKPAKKAAKPAKKAAKKAAKPRKASQAAAVSAPRARRTRAPQAAPAMGEPGSAAAYDPAAKTWSQVPAVKPANDTPDYPLMRPVQLRVFDAQKEPLRVERMPAQEALQAWQAALAAGQQVEITTARGQRMVRRGDAYSEVLAADLIAAL